MAEPHAELFRDIRREVLSRLVEIRGSLDQSFASLSPERISEQFDTVLDRMLSYLVTGEPEAYRSFASRWMAIRIGSGDPPQNLIHVVVAIGDVVMRAGQSRLGPGPEAAEFSRVIARMTFTASRMLVEELATELEGRRKQLRSLASQGSPA